MYENADRLCVNTLRFLAADMVEAAQSGHPGTPMAMAPVVYALWQRVLRYDPAAPSWPGRDRFVLSAGHASALLYALLHLSGVAAADAAGRPEDRPALALEDLRRFRQVGSPCAGHPEYELAAGIETTTGPLGQGLATSVGMALAARWKARRFDRPGFDLFGHDVYALCGDGCLMEGVSAEAASLAGHLRLGNLCWIYDSNRITIEGPTSLAFSEDVAARFRAYGWFVEEVEDAEDLVALESAFASFQESRERPTLIRVQSHIAYGAPHKQDTAAAHGEPLGAEELRLAKRFHGWPEEAPFRVPEEARAHLGAGLGARGRALRETWEADFAEYRRQFPDLAGEWDRMGSGGLPEGWDADLPRFPPDAKGLATRESSGQVLNAVARRVPWLLGGAADLAPSTKTRLTFEGAGDLTPEDAGGRNVHFGVREHAMAAAVNGLCLEGLRAYGAGFLVFSDYARPAIRLSALMALPAIHVFTHDSLGVGEDGPTHQPVEHLASLRAVPGLLVVRPADANEVAEAWRMILELRREPAALILTRQPLPTLDRNRYAPAAGLRRGGYVLADAPGGPPEVILLATGSEVGLCVAAHETLLAEGVRSRVVSLPCWELFDRQPDAYREAVLPHQIRARLAVEMGSPLGWAQYVGLDGRVLGMDHFGASGPFQDLRERFGFTGEAVAAAAREVLAQHRGTGLVPGGPRHGRVAAEEEHA
ncbi:MAG: transketolase [Deferrisomatales bacterium]|nr:transketolase [Deferrisomatales bacterium]